MTVAPVSDSFASAAHALELAKILQHLASHCHSALGAERLLQLLPLPTLAETQTRLDEITEMRGLLDAGETVPIASFPDLRSALQQLQLEGRALEPRELIDLALFLATARRVRGFLLSQRERCPLLHGIVQGIMNLQAEEHAVETAISFVDGSIKDSASPALHRIRKDIVRATSEAREALQRFAKKLAERDMLQENMITLREGRLVLMLKDEYRSRVSGLIHDESASGKTVFIEPMESVALNNRIRQLHSAEREEIERILLELSNRFRQVLPALHANHERMLQIDMIHAKAVAAQHWNAHAPELQSAPRLKLLGARHPLLLLRAEGQPERSAVVPLDLELGHEAAHQDARIHTLIISGPNAGGKTVALKTAGLLALMIRCGLHVPAEPDSEIPLFNQIFVDIGDRQSIEDDLSTFTSHMSRLVEILRRAQPGDLVLLDEIGVGTDPEAGASLSMAILKELHQRQCLTIATTHHGALKNFAQSEPGMQNGCMDFDQATLTPTYRFRAGLPGASYAFEIAARMGLESRLIETARTLTGNEQSSVETLLADLQARLSEQKQLTARLQEEESQLREARTQYQERHARFKAQEQQLRQEAVAAAEALLQNANAAIEHAIREVREQNASRDAIRAAKESVQAVREQVAAEREDLISPPPAASEASLDLQPGTPALWLKQNSTVTILEAPDATNRVLIGAGILRARVPVAELRAISTPVQKPAAAVPKILRAGTNTSPEIDLRGMRLEEAIHAVDKFLDEALLAGWQQVRLIHGKGTGALRNGIAAHLKNYPGVSRFGYAAMGEGDYGVTVVEF
jgi:DNA mismatch repair protein MutS2